MDFDDLAGHDHSECVRQADKRQHAITAAITDHQESCVVAITGGGPRLVSRYALVAEYMDPDGERRVQLHLSDGLDRVSLAGLLRVAQTTMGC